MDAQIQRALAHPQRMAVLGYLRQKRGEEGTDEAELADSLDLTTAKVKYHLLVLCGAALTSHVDDLVPGATGRFIAAALASK